MAYKEATEIENAEIKIFRLCKTAVENLYSKERFKREVDKIIDEVCDKLHSEELKQKVIRSLRLYAQRIYAKQREILIESGMMYAVLLSGTHKRNSDAIRQKKTYDNAFSDKFRHSPGFLSVLEKELTNVTYPTAIPLGIYHKNYMRRVENLTNELIKARAKEDYTTNVSLRNIAEMTVRYEHQLNMIDEKRRSGKKLVYILAHSNCSERCQKYQVGGTKHPSGLYSLDGTSGVTEDGIRYLPLEFATDNPDDLYTTKAGTTYQNGCLTGFNCRHKLGDYVPGVRPEPIPDSVIQKRREIEAKQREYERQIREYTKAEIAFHNISPRLAKKYSKAAKTKADEYRKFAKENDVAWHPERVNLFEDDIDKVLTYSKENDIIYLNKRFSVVMPNEKFVAYSLNPQRAPDKAEAFKQALGYDQNNYNELKQNIIEHIDESKFVPKGDSGYGMRYECIIEIIGPNKKSANVLTAWIQDGKHKRLTSLYVTKKKGDK